MPSGTTSFDINGSSYRLAGNVEWSISGTTVTWTMRYTTYEWVTKQGNYYCFQGLTNSAVRLYVGSSYVTAANQYTGYAAGTHSSRSSAGWVQAKTGTLTATTTVTTGTISVRPTIVIPNVSTTLPHTLAWNVSYNGNGSDGGSTASQMKIIGTNLVLRSNGFTRQRYSFTGWNTAADGSGTSYSPGDSYGLDAALTLYAQWIKDNIPLFANVGGVIRQAEKAYANIPNVGVREVTVYTNVGGAIKPIL